MSSWRIEVKPTAETQYLRLDKKTRLRIKEALTHLEEEKRPLLYSEVRPLTGQLKGDYRFRVGDWRILFTADRERKVFFVYAILPRGGAY